MSNPHENNTTFPPKSIEKYFKTLWMNEPKDMETQITKITPDALKLTCEFLRLYVEEGFHRSQEEAMVDDSPYIELQHVEQTLTQLLLDF